VSAADSVFIAEAIELAEKGRFTCAPNPTVGCVIFREGKVLGRGFHERTGEGHAEGNALDDAGGEVNGATVYLTLEPCAFVGRTPACANTLVEAGVARVVVATLDPHPKVAGAGVKILRQSGIQVDVLDLPEAEELIAGYVMRELDGRPFVRVKTASSIDGAVSLATGESKWITGDEAREDVQYWRARSDAILTGVETVIADDPQLNVRAEQFSHCKQPLRVILDSALRAPLNCRLLKDGAATLLVHREGVDVPESVASASQLSCLALPDGPADLEAVLRHLAELGCNEVLVEAGAGVCGSFAEAGLWDEWLSYIAPKWLGGDARSLADFQVADLATAPKGTVIDVTQIGDDIRIRIRAEDVSSR